MTDPALYPVFKQPDYDPTILSDDEANALLTEDFSMAPEEWDYWASCYLKDHTSREEHGCNYLLTGVFKDIVAFARKQGGDIFWDFDARRPIRSTQNILMASYKSPRIKPENEPYIGIRVYVSPYNDLLIGGTYAVTIRTQRNELPYRFLNIAVVW
tara:strand:- start:451 stop:918 length:468 start_codon:yes stop_codon:yes gene_type:complete